MVRWCGICVIEQNGKSQLALHHWHTNNQDSFKGAARGWGDPMDCFMGGGILDNVSLVFGGFRGIPLGDPSSSKRVVIFFSMFDGVELCGQEPGGQQDPGGARRPIFSYFGCFSLVSDGPMVRDLCN